MLKEEADTMKKSKMAMPQLAEDDVLHTRISLWRSARKRSEPIQDIACS